MMAHTYSRLSACRPRAWGSSPSTCPGGVSTKRSAFLQRRFWRSARSTTTIKAREGSPSHIDDVVEGITRTASNIPEPCESRSLKSPNPSESSRPYLIYNIGNDETVTVNRVIESHERITGRTAEPHGLRARRNNVRAAYADTSALEQTGFCLSISIGKGLGSFVEWYRDYYRIQEAGTPSSSRAGTTFSSSVTLRALLRPACNRSTR